MADHVAVKGRWEVFDLDRAGPWLLVKLPRAATRDATYEGKTAAGRRRGCVDANADWRSAERLGYFDVGMMNSAPFGVDAGQRCITDFCRV